MNLRFAILLVMLIGCFDATAVEDPRSADELSLAQVFERLSDAWQAGDGDAWAEEFVRDADFTVWFGFGMKGKEDIARGHQFIFDRFYEKTQLVIDVQQIRIVNENAAVVHMGMSVIKEGEEPPEVSDVVPMAVLARIEKNWKIVAFQNTPNLEGRYGDIREFKKTLADSHQPQ